MKNWKEICKRLLWPGKVLTVLIPILGFGLLGAVFYFHLEETPLGYASYPLAFYALTVLVIALIPAVRTGIARRKEHAAAAQDKPVRRQLYRSLTINLGFALFNLISGAVYQSAWLFSNGLYYVILSLIRLVLVLYERKMTHAEDAALQQRIGWQSFRTCGFLLLILNLTMTGMVFQMVWQGMGSRYGEIVVIAMAAYTFYRLTSAIIRVVQTRRNANPMLGSVRNISLTAAMMSLYSLQTALLHSYSTDPELTMLMNSLTGTAVCLLEVLGAIGMAVHGNRRVRELKKQNS